MRDKKRFFVILFSLFAGSFVPIQLITLSFGYAQYFKGIEKGKKLIMTAHEFAKFYIPIIYVPSLIILLLILWYSYKNYKDIFNRAIIGLLAGAFSTIFLDFFRMIGVINKWLPGDTPLLFGKMATLSKNFIFAYIIGFIIHFLNGADFGLFFTFIFGKGKNYFNTIIYAVFWSILVEIGMMTLPPMAPMVGAFGKNYAWPHLFLITLIAHIAFGVSLGFIVHYFLKDERNIFQFLKGEKI